MAGRSIALERDGDKKNAPVNRLLPAPDFQNGRRDRTRNAEFVERPGLESILTAVDVPNEGVVGRLPPTPVDPDLIAVEVRGQRFQRDFDLPVLREEAQRRLHMRSSLSSEFSYESNLKRPV